MSTQPVPQPSWKEEVNRRLEAHKTRRGISVVDQNAQDGEHGAVSDRAAQAAARVAARFSKAPSYSEMQAAEARTALRNAEVATRAALEAQVVAQAALANLTTAAEEEHIGRDEAYPEHTNAYENPSPEPEPVPTGGSAVHESSRSWKVRWEPDLPVRTAAHAPAPVQVAAEAQYAEDDHAIATVEPAQPIHANLINFPREIVATRRMRRRLVSDQEGAVSEQLSIFEVDPNSISIDPMSSAGEAALPAPSWCEPEWSRIELDAHPRHEPQERRGPVVASTPAVHLAPLELRLMAATIDFALILGLVCAAAAGVAGHMQHMQSMKFAEMAAVVALVFTGVLYEAFFLLTTGSTPGMMYAGISLCTFDEEHPTRAQLRARLGALLISILPVGLGLAWAIFDEDHLCWHDRHSRMYQRKC